MCDSAGHRSHDVQSPGIADFRLQFGFAGYIAPRADNFAVRAS